MALLMADEDQVGWNFLTKAVILLTWGQAIEVLDRMLKAEIRASPSTPDTGMTGGQAARMLRPGAVISGYIFKMFGLIMLGPLDEKRATVGAEESKNSMLFMIAAIGSLDFLMKV